MMRADSKNPPSPRLCGSAWIDKRKINCGGRHYSWNPVLVPDLLSSLPFSVSICVLSLVDLVAEVRLLLLYIFPLIVAMLMTQFMIIVDVYVTQKWKVLRWSWEVSILLHLEDIVEWYLDCVHYLGWCLVDCFVVRTLQMNIMPWPQWNAINCVSCVKQGVMTDSVSR